MSVEDNHERHGGGIGSHLEQDVTSRTSGQHENNHCISRRRIASDSHASGLNVEVSVMNGNAKPECLNSTKSIKHTTSAKEARNNENRARNKQQRRFCIEANQTKPQSEGDYYVVGVKNTTHQSTSPQLFASVQEGKARGVG